ncbi:hypothetical protein F5879DRAFT_1061779 [Lentinula edodes]|nr:hypothetical protein F5879DRAFT_1061779 [Lentinula edodes]
MQITRQGPLPNDPSIISANRTRKTHKDAETISRISKLPIESKLRINFNKQTRNASRRERVFEGNDDVSDVSSYLSIPEEEYDKMLKDQDYFDKVKAWLSAHTISWPREGDDTSVEASGTQPSKRFRSNDDLIEIDPTSPPNVFFDQAFLDLGLYGYHIPLALFTNKNVEFLNNNSISFHRTKISHIEGKPQILDLADVIKKVKGSREGGPTQDLAIEHFEWLEATANFFVYQSLLYAEGDEANEPQFYRKHFGFFENQTDSVKLLKTKKLISTSSITEQNGAALNHVLTPLKPLPRLIPPSLSLIVILTSRTSGPPKSLGMMSHPQHLRIPFRLATRKRPPANLVASSAEASVIPSSLIPTLPMAQPSGHYATGRSSSTHPASASHVCTFCGGSHPALQWDPSCTVSRPGGY